MNRRDNQFKNQIYVSAVQIELLMTGNGEVALLRMAMPFKHFLLLPGWPASAALLLSRVGCRCAGTSRPIRRSREEAAAPSRSTADRVPLAPVFLRFHLNTAEDRREKRFTGCGSSGGCAPIKVRGWRRAGGADNPTPCPFPTRPRRAAFTDNEESLTLKMMHSTEQKV